MPNTTGGTIAVRVAAPGRGVYQDVIAPTDDPTVGGILNELRERGVDYNGTDVVMFLNGRPVETDAPVTDGASLVIVADKPTGN